MRITALALSATLLSGCSWLGLGGSNHSSAPQYSQSGRYTAGAGGAAGAGYNAMSAYQNSFQSSYNSAHMGGPCEITSVSHPIPQGCSPEQVTIALPGASHAQYGANYGAVQQPSQNAYGKAVKDAKRNSGLVSAVTHNNWARPRLRLTGSLGFEDSVSGQLYNVDTLSSVYDPTTHFESTAAGSPAAGQVIENEYYVPNPLGTPSATNPSTSVENTFILVDSPTVNVGDAYTLPFSAGIGGEYQVSNNFAVFGNLSYSKAQAEHVSGIRYEGNVENYQQVTDYEEITDPISGDVTGYNDFPAAPGRGQFNNVTVASTTVELSDRRRSAAEIGGRYYFGHAFPNHLERPLTPYISAKVGAAYHNALEAEQTLSRLYLEEYYTSGGATATYENVLAVQAAPVEIIEEGWVPTGGLHVGAEWQITPKAALAFETGVNIEGGRDLTAGGKTNNHISVPFTLRGSIGF